MAGKYPILAGVGILLAAMGQLVAAIVANLIGGLIFFWVDQFIFTSQSLAAQWEVRENIRCVDCGTITRATGWSGPGTTTRARMRRPSSGARRVRKRNPRLSKTKASGQSNFFFTCGIFFYRRTGGW